MIPVNPDSVLVARRTLVGKLLKNKAMNKVAAKEVIAKPRASYENLQISDLGRNKLLFTFIDERHSREVMNHGPWFFLNHLMCLQFWMPSVSPEEIYFDSNPFWIQVHNLPMEYLNSSNVTTILQKVGRVAETEESIF